MSFFFFVVYRINVQTLIIYIGLTLIIYINLSLHTLKWPLDDVHVL